MEVLNLDNFSQMNKFGLFRVATVSPELKVADIYFNSKEILHLSKEISDQGARMIVFPELSITGYSCGDLFFQSHLLEKTINALCDIKTASKDIPSLILLGFPLKLEGRLYNCSVVICGGKILGIVPKSFLPSTGEFYENRWFSSGLGLKNREINIAGESIPFGTDLIFRDESFPEFSVGVEICEDLWSVNPPSSSYSVLGATVIANLSASNELLGKSEYRRKLVEQQSARCISTYIYSSSGPNESSADVVYSGHGLICENGKTLAETNRFEFSSQYALADIDVFILESDRTKNAGFKQTYKDDFFRKINFSIPKSKSKTQVSVKRKIEKNPFVPKEIEKRNENCKEILSIQSFGLAKRLKSSGIKKVVIGVSGGLDSTLAILVSVEACKILKLPFENILAISMPGFGTTDRTKQNAEKLCQNLGVSFQVIPICDSVLTHFKDIGCDPNVLDSTYENAQARERTQILMDIANQKNGLVVGTGDLSEIALGWCTYNADHISMYNVNSGVPKTLVKYIVEWCSVFQFSGTISSVLRDICETPISPELLPSDGKSVTQKTEDLIGPYELHDFFLYYFLRFQFSPEKILFFAKIAYEGEYSTKEILQWMKIFFQRFFQNQFKRSAMPDGPKVGSVALSQRGDWRMPSDVEQSLWLEEIQRIAKDLNFS